MVACMSMSSSYQRRQQRKRWKQRQYQQTDSPCVCVGVRVENQNGKWYKEDGHLDILWRHAIKCQIYDFAIIDKW